MARLKPRYNGSKISGYCAVFYDPDRRPKEKSVTLRTRDKRIAHRRLDDYEDKFSRGEWDPWAGVAPEDGLLLEQAISRFVSAREGRLRPSTIRSDKSVLSNFSQSLPPATMLAHIETKHIERYLANLRAKSRSSATRRTYATRIRKFFKWCVKSGFIATDPTESLEMPRLRKKEKQYLTREQFGRLERAIKADLVLQKENLQEGQVAWMLDVIHIAVETGMRRAEICNMRWSWVSFDRQEITVRNAHGFVPKSGHERTIPFGGNTLKILGRLREERVDESQASFVLKSVTGKQGDGRGLNADYLSKRFLHYRQMAKLPEGISFHSLRHTFCTWMIQANVEVPVVQKLAGHADITTTMGYVHLAGKDLHSAVDAAFGDVRSQSDVVTGGSLP